MDMLFAGARRTAEAGVVPNAYDIARNRQLLAGLVSAAGFVMAVYSVASAVYSFGYALLDSSAQFAPGQWNGWPWAAWLVLQLGASGALIVFSGQIARLLMPVRTVAKCPRCDYACVSLVEPRCPECGLELTAEFIGGGRGADRPGE